MILKFLLLIVLCIGIIFFLPVAQFRKPTGEYGVGRVAYHWVDESRQELNTKDPQYREVMVYVYYPTDVQNNRATKSYGADALASEKVFIAAKSHWPTWLLQGWNFIKTYAEDEAALSQAAEQFPVIIIPHGGGTMIQHYTWMLEQLASCGYVVVGINHPYMAAVTRFPDGRVVPSIVHQTKDKEKLQQWKQEQVDTCVQDIDFVIHKIQDLATSPGSFFYHKLDTHAMGIAGHSFGGHLALIVAAQNSAIKAAVNMDGGQRALPYILGKSFTTPSLLMFAEKSRQWKGADGQRDRKLLEQFVHEHQENVQQVVIPHAGHGLFSDLPLLMHTIFYSRWLSSWYNFDFDTTCGVASDAIEKVSQELVQFFDKNLKK